MIFDRTLLSENFPCDRKIIFLRVDFNVSLLDHNVVDDYRMVKSLPTINYLLQKNCKIVILSHLGRPKNKEDLNKISLRCVAKHLETLVSCPVHFVADSVAIQVEEKNPVIKIKANFNLGKHSFSWFKWQSWKWLWSCFS